MLENRFLHSIDKLYGYLIKIGSNLHSVFLLYMRVIWGHQLFLSGIFKLGHIDQIAQFFASLNIGAPLVNAYAVAIFETVCGILFFFGFATRLAAIPVFVIMLTALATHHAPMLSDLKFLFQPMVLLHQEPYPFLLTSLILFVFGPGRVSLDAWVKRWADRQPRY